MAKTRVKKELESSALTERLQKMKVAVLTTTAGLKVKDMTELRTALRAEGVEYVVAKKTLVRRALSAAKLEQVDLAPVDSSFSLTFGYDDEVTPAKLLAQFAKTHEAL
ncbi:MAG: 50S ribosomal protein L10, partial [Candidatus Kerfeldbacteria bacterium]|nr:50S ribosomal protein L10 [Candidatus Kerfeldbacteria bacterium]